MMLQVNASKPIFCDNPK